MPLTEQKVVNLLNDLRRRIRVQPVGTRSNQIGIAGRQNLGTTGRTVRVGHTVPFACTHLQLLYANFYSGGWGETPNTDNIATKGAIEYPLNSIYPAPFEGTRVLTMDGNTIQATLPLGFDVRPVTGTCIDNAASTTVFVTTLTGNVTNRYGGQIIQFTSGANSGLRRYVTPTGFNTSTGALTVASAFPQAPAYGDTFKIIPVVYSRTFVAAPSATVNIPVGMKLWGGGSSAPFEGSTTGSDLCDGGGTPGTSVTTCYSPVALLGIPLNGVITSWALGGDSIAEGTGDPDSGGTNSLGFMRRGMNDNYPYVHLAKGGEKTTHYTNFTPSTGSRVRRIAVAKGCTHHLYNYGTNDLSTMTLAQIQTEILEITAGVNATGAKCFWVPMPPKTGSTDGWATTANQTPTSQESLRVSVNDWLRDLSTSGYMQQAGGAALAGIVDAFSVIEVNSSNVLTTDGGYWLAGGAATDSGTATAGGATTLTDAGKSWTVNAFAGYYVFILAGTGAGQQAAYIVSNTATQLTINTAWATNPDATSQYVIIATPPTIDGTHPSIYSHIAAGAYIQNILATISQL